jgi:hypothetical protein
MAGRRPQKAAGEHFAPVNGSEAKTNADQTCGALTMEEQFK